MVRPKLHIGGIYVLQFDTGSPYVHVYICMQEKILADFNLVKDRRIQISSKQVCMATIVSTPGKLGCTFQQQLRLQNVLFCLRPFLVQWSQVCSLQVQTTAGNIHYNMASHGAGEKKKLGCMSYKLGSHTCMQIMVGVV